MIVIPSSGSTCLKIGSRNSISVPRFESPCSLQRPPHYFSHNQSNGQYKFPRVIHLPFTPSLCKNVEISLYLRFVIRFSTLQNLAFSTSTANFSSARPRHQTGFPSTLSLTSISLFILFKSIQFQPFSVGNPL